MIKLIASDMDGTLLNSKHKLNPEFQYVMNKLAEKNIIFAPTSGRNFGRLKNIFKNINYDFLYISDNGNYISYKEKVLYKNTIKKDDLKILLKEIKSMKKYCRASFSNHKEIYIEDKLAHKIGSLFCYKSIFTKNILNLNEDIIKCSILCLTKNQDLIINKLKEKLPHLNIVKSSKHSIDVCPEGTNKGLAIERVKNILNIQKENVMVFGDYLNDLEMMDVAHHSYAMENAHPDLKKKANYIAPSNNDNGVLEVIKNIVLKDKITNF